MTFHDIETYLLCPLKFYKEKDTEPILTLDEAVMTTLLKRPVVPAYEDTEDGMFKRVLELFKDTEIKPPMFIHVTKRKPDFDNLSQLFRLHLEWLSVTQEDNYAIGHYAVMTKTPYILEHKFILPQANLRIGKVIDSIQNSGGHVPHGLVSPYACKACQFCEECEYIL